MPSPGQCKQKQLLLVKRLLFSSTILNCLLDNDKIPRQLKLRHTSHVTWPIGAGISHLCKLTKVCKRAEICHLEPFPKICFPSLQLPTPPPEHTSNCFLFLPPPFALHLKVCLQCHGDREQLTSTGPPSHPSLLTPCSTKWLQGKTIILSEGWKKKRERGEEEICFRGRK